MHCLLDYCNALYTGLPASTLALFQRVLHAAARLVLNLRPRDHVSAALKELHWLLVAQRIDYKLCLLVHKSSRGQAPEYVSNMLKPAANDPQLTTLRTAANGNYVVVPRTNCRLDDRAFSVAAPKAWNSLPTDLKTATCSTDAFKRRLKTWLFKMAYDWYTDWHTFYHQRFMLCAIGHYMYSRRRNTSTLFTLFLWKYCHKLYILPETRAQWLTFLSSFTTLSGQIYNLTVADW